MLPREFCFPSFPYFSDPADRAPAHSHTDQGQGGAQAIEDGAALGAIFNPSLWPSDTSFADPSLPTLTHSLELFESVRKNRASVMQILSSVGQDEAALVHDKAKTFMENGQEVPRNQIVRSA